MGNRAVARIMFGSTRRRSGTSDIAREAWSDFVDTPPPHDGIGLLDLCQKVGLDACGVGHFESETVAIGFEIARVCSDKTIDVPDELDVPDEMRELVTELCDYFGCSPPRVILVPGSE